MNVPIRSKFGVIPTDLICRFTELTKTEIVVLSYLYAARNRTTGQCNPKQKVIAEMIQIGKTHVSPALKSLEAKGWIVQDRDGSFLLVYEPPKVTESVTSKLPNRQLKVTESVTKVTESVTESYQIGNSLNKDWNIQGTYKEHTIEQRDGEAPNPLFVAYREFFPLNHLTIRQMDAITIRISDETAWRTTLRFWSENDYRAQSIAKMCDYYDEEVQGKHAKGTNGTNSGYGSKRRTDQDVARESIEFYKNYPPDQS